jgi:hypothetical protein
MPKHNTHTVPFLALSLPDYTVLQPRRQQSSSLLFASLNSQLTLPVDDSTVQHTATLYSHLTLDFSTLTQSVNQSRSTLPYIHRANCPPTSEFFESSQARILEAAGSNLLCA